MKTIDVYVNALFQIVLFWLNQLGITTPFLRLLIATLLLLSTGYAAFVEYTAGNIFAGSVVVFMTLMVTVHFMFQAGPALVALAGRDAEIYRQSVPGFGRRMEKVRSLRVWSLPLLATGILMLSASPSGMYMLISNACFIVALYLETCK